MAGVSGRACVVVPLVLLLHIYCLDFTIATRTAETHPATSDFTRHTLVKPKVYHGRDNRPLTSSKEESGEHTHHLRLDYELNGENHILDLRLNRELIPQGYFTRVQKNGKHVVNKPTAEHVELCQYTGHLRALPDSSWAALSTCGGQGLSGVIYDGTELHYVHAVSSSSSSSSEGNQVRIVDDHVFYAHGDLEPESGRNRTCGYKGGEHDGHSHYINDDASGENGEFNRILRYKRSAESTVRGPYNANKQSRFVELVLVVDNREYKEFGESVSRVEKHCKDIANIINGLYAPLNIFIALVGVVIWTEYDEIDFSTNGDTTLTNFLHYRREKLIKEHPNDNAQLLTKFTFENGVVGKALKGPICTYEFSGGVNTDHSAVLGLVATTVAHEMGHNFGMEHDSNECLCPTDRCIMAPSSSSIPPTHWSKCSLDYLAVAFEHGMDYCLRNRPLSLFGSPVCGNGFVEEGEQCDCGLEGQCKGAAACCNASTCMLYRNASCATGECCNLETCKPKTAGTECRSADYECDLPEYCTGQSEYCPPDIYKRDTEPCEGGRAYCYQGCCRTRSDQCKLLWGDTGQSSDDQCYRMNTKGSRHGNCGYNKLNQSYFKCVDENVLCGMLHCKHLNERLEFGMESVSILSHSFINLKGEVIPCRTAIIDLGLNQVDPGLSPDGAKCGPGKMCVNQKCMAVDSLRQEIGGCANDCYGHGYCNSMGHCHCDKGYAPPNCDFPGVGGSEDSGPAEDPNSNTFMNVTLILFVGILPALVLIAIGTSMLRRKLSGNSGNTGNGSAGGGKSPTVSKSPPKSRGNTGNPDHHTSPKHHLNNTEDNHSLLAEHSADSRIEFFGHFKGYTLTPIKKSQSPTVESPPQIVRPAPAIPVISGNSISKKSPTVRNKLAVKPIIRAAHQSFKTNNSVALGLITSNEASVAPALPPLNPGLHPRPIISSPILEASTCTAKELVSPLRNANSTNSTNTPKVPIRPAPEIPEILINPVFIEPVALPAKKPREANRTLSRIASFLKPKSSTNTTTTTTNAVVVNNSHHQDNNKNLRSLEISSPVPQTHIDIAITALPVERAETRVVVMRAQSMRGSNPVVPRPKLPTFGSMRDASRRPVSIPSGVRPKSPPPPRPSHQDSSNLPDYQEPQSTHYDDCLNSTPSSGPSVIGRAPLANISEGNSPTDNIYSVIAESPMISTEKQETTVTNSSPSGSSTENCSGLLGEIVSEIQNRNLDSIYSTSTLARKKKLQQGSKLSNESEDSEYVNATVYGKESASTDDGEYSNMTVKSSASSTVSSAYISPNPPVLPINKVSTALNSNKTDGGVTKPAMSSFKTSPSSKQTNVGSPDSNTSNSDSKTSNSDSKTSNSNSDSKATNSITPYRRQNSGGTKADPLNKPQAVVKTLNRQITPPNLRTRKPSPIRNSSGNTVVTNTSPKLPKTTAQSKLPDLVVNTTTGSKPSTVKPSPTVNLAKPSPAVNFNKPSSTVNVNKPLTVGASKPSTIIKPTLPVRSVSNTGKTTTTGNKGGGSLAEKKLVKPPIAAKTTKGVDVVVVAADSGKVKGAKQSSNVANLQQKFESKSSTPGNSNATSK